MSRRFFLNPAQAGESLITISGPDANHMKNVLRLNPGDIIILFDGSENEYEARIDSFSSEGAEVSIIRNIKSLKESPAEIAIAQGFLKDKKMDTLIRQLTEMGIRRWIPFFAERSVPRPDAKRLEARDLRWKKIAQETLKQCQRTRMPEISPTLSFTDMLKANEGCDLKLIFWEEKAGSSESIRHLSGTCKKIFAVMGPEGGFSVKEIESAQKQGFIPAALGPRIMRAETASIAACTLLQIFFGDIK